MRDLQYISGSLRIQRFECFYHADLKIWLDKWGGFVGILPTHSTDYHLILEQQSALFDKGSSLYLWILKDPKICGISSSRSNDLSG
jgi:hypothetical protein